VTVRDKNIGGELSQTKSRPKAASQFKPGDRVSGGHRCWLGFPTVSYEPHGGKAQDHHSPSWSLGHGRLDAHGEAIPIFTHRIGPWDRIKRSKKLDGAVCFLTRNSISNNRYWEIQRPLGETQTAVVLAALAYEANAGHRGYSAQFQANAIASKLEQNETKLVCSKRAVRPEKR